MDAWAQLYETPAPMASDWGHHRIYAPAAYRIARTLPIVPIVHTEVLSLAPLFPVCWSLARSEPTLCVLRSLLEDGVGIPGGVKAASGFLPLALQAYPIVVPHDEASSEDRRIVVDRVIADEPTDIGAPLMMSDGQLTRGAAMRVRAALAAGRTLPATRAISQFLYETELLEPWPLQFDLGGGRSVDIADLQVVSWSRLDDPKIYKAVLEFGAEAAVFLSASRLSLFRISGLLAAARSAVAAQTREASGPAKRAAVA